MLQAISNKTEVMGKKWDNPGWNNFRWTVCFIFQDKKGRQCMHSKISISANASLFSEQLQWQQQAVDQAWPPAVVSILSVIACGCDCVLLTKARVYQREEQHILDLCVLTSGLSSDFEIKTLSYQQKTHAHVQSSILLLLKFITKTWLYI